MAWVRLADDFYRHPKVLQAGPLAGWLWVSGLGYANHYLTDGYVPRAAVRGLTDLDDPFRLAAQLVEAQLWDVADGGYRIHDYAQYQPSADSVRAERAANAERVAAWRERRRNDRSNGVRPDVRNGVSPGSPGPGPGPVNPDPDPAGSPPKPPSHAKGAGSAINGRGRGSSVAAGAALPSEVPDIAAPTPDDLRVWELALGVLARLVSSANFETYIATLELDGRAPDGGLRLRAPPSASSMALRFRAIIATALDDAGDAAYARVAIVT